MITRIPPLYMFYAYGQPLSFDRLTHAATISFMSMLNAGYSLLALPRVRMAQRNSVPISREDPPPETW